MHPSFVEDAPQSQRGWRQALRPLLRALGVCGRILFRSLWRHRPTLKIEVGTRASRLLRGVCYRLLFVPLILALFASALVYTGTHPQTAAAAMDPTCNGIYYDPIMFNGEDGTHLEGWLIPVLDARRVLADKDKALTEHSPAIVLVHDYACS